MPVKRSRRKDGWAGQGGFSHNGDFPVESNRADGAELRQRERTICLREQVRCAVGSSTLQDSGGPLIPNSRSNVWRAISIVLIHALESLFKFRDQRSFTGLETAVSAVNAKCRFYVESVISCEIAMSS